MSEQPSRAMECSAMKIKTQGEITERLYNKGKEPDEMKTIEELYSEVLASEELKKEFLALKPEEVEGFAAKYGCKASLDEIKAFFEAKKNQAGALSDEEMDQIAGGKTAELGEAAWSFGTLGIGCIGSVVKSLALGNVGTGIEGKGMLCDAV